MIEIAPQQHGFQSICCSPTGLRLDDQRIYDHWQTAWRAAMLVIDDSYARAALHDLLRELYEIGHLGFEEWQLLRQSLHATIPTEM